MDPAAALANRILDRHPWAQERLAAHAGRTFVVAIGPLSTALAADAAGRLAAASPVDAALTLRLSPLDAPAFLANPARWGELLRIDGDAALASTLAELAQTLPWFVEELFTGVLGPIVGQRVADAGRRLLALPEHAALRFGDSALAYARDEAQLIAHGADFRRLVDATAALTDRVDALAPRIEALARRLDAAASGRDR